MEIYKAQIIAAKLMAKHGITCPLKISRGKKTLGTCHWKYGKGGIPEVSHISLSRYLISLNGEEEVRETILHEIAHALVGYSHGHDRVWKLKAMEIGCTPHRLDFKAKMPEGKIAAVCPRCKKVVGHRHRRSQNMHRHVHRGCGTRIVWVNNNQREIDRAMQMPIPEKQPTTPLEQLHALLAKPHRFVRTNPPARTVVKTKAPEKVDDIVNL
jgi:predicted SprT family Zn-dependent metalloprotease